MKVPFLDLRAQYVLIQNEMATAIQQVVDKTAFAGGPFVEAFERDFAAFCQCRHAVGVGSGTDALWLALLGLGVGAGDEVITVPNTFIATAEAITLCGARPVFVDIDEKTYNMNTELVEAVITGKTKAIIPVHLYGQCADMDPILAVARKHGLVVVEDACQAHGAEYKGRKAGSMGDAGCFSFYPGKNLGAYGEAGAVVTNNPELTAWMRMFRDHGQQKKYCHSVVGWNARMDGIQGAVLSVKLKHLPEWNEARRRNAQLYTELLADVHGVVTPGEADYARHIYHIYSILIKNRDDVIQTLAAKDIHCGIHYPVPLHLQEAYASLHGGPGNFHVAETCASQQLSLPMFAELTSDQIRAVVGELRQVVPHSPRDIA
jgi:dTDP-4-amino-4,6-dideoxygalactose transaminase